MMKIYLDFVRKILVVLAIIVICAISRCGGVISDKRLCYDPKCSVPMSLARTLLRYPSPERDLLSFSSGQNVTVYSKSAGSRTDLWGVEINGKRGYVPNSMLREYKIFKSNSTYEVPTELGIQNAGSTAVPRDENQDALKTLKENESIDTKSKPIVDKNPLETVKNERIENAKTNHIDPISVPLPVPVPVPDLLVDIPSLSTTGNIKETAEKFVANMESAFPSYEIIDGTAIPLPADQVPIAPSQTTSVPSSTIAPDEQPILTVHPNLAPNIKPFVTTFSHLQNHQPVQDTTKPKSNDVAENETNKSKATEQLTVSPDNKVDSTVIQKNVINDGKFETKVEPDLISEKPVEKKITQTPEKIEPKISNIGVNENNLQGILDNSADNSSESANVEDGISHDGEVSNEQSNNILPTINPVENFVKNIETTDSSSNTESTLNDNKPLDIIDVQYNKIFNIFNANDNTPQKLPELTNVIDQTSNIPEISQFDTSSLENLKPTQKTETFTNDETFVTNTKTTENDINEEEKIQEEGLIPMNNATILDSDKQVIDVDTTISNKTVDVSEIDEVVIQPEIDNAPFQAMNEVVPAVTETLFENIDLSPESLSAYYEEQLKIARSLLNIKDDGEVDYNQLNTDTSNSRESDDPETLYLDQPTAYPIEDVTGVPTEDVTGVSTEDVTGVSTEDVTGVSTEDVTVLPTEDVTVLSTEDVTEHPVPDTTNVNDEILSENPEIDMNEENEEVSEELLESNLYPEPDVEVQNFSSDDLLHTTESIVTEKSQHEGKQLKLTFTQPASSYDVCDNDSGCPDANDGATSADQKHVMNEDLWNLSGMVLERRDYWQTLLYLIVTAVTTLLFSLGYYYIESRTRDKELIAKINKLEKELLVATKENILLDDGLKTTKNKLNSIEDESFGSNEMVSSLKIELEASENTKRELEDQIVALEKELESATEVGLEFERMLREFLASQNDENPLAQSLEDLQTRLNAQQATNESLTNSLNFKSQENEALAAELAYSHKKIRDFEAEVTKLTEEIKSLTCEKIDLEKDLSNKVQVLTKQIANISEEKATLTSQLATTKMELNDLSEVMKQQSTNNLDLGKLFEVSRIKAEAQLIVEERDELKIKYQELDGAHQLLEEHMKLIKEEIASVTEQYELAERDKTEAQTRLEVLSNYFKEKENQLQKELGMQEALWVQKQGEVTSTVDRIQTMQNEIQNYRQQIETLKREILDQEREYKSQIAALETKTHEQWVIARQSERRLEESKAEASQLRNRLTLVEKSINDVDPDAKLHRMETNGETAASPPLFMGGETSSSPIIFTGSSGVPPLPPSYMYGNPLPPPFIPPPPHPAGGTPYDISRRPPPLGARLSSPPPLPLHHLPSRFDDGTSPPPPLSPPLHAPYNHCSPPPYSNDRIHPPPPFLPPLGTSHSWGDETLPPLRNSVFHPHQREQRSRNHKGSLHSSGDSLDKTHHTGKV